MKKQIKKWAFRLAVTALFLFGLLVTFMLSPVLLYANKTVIGNYSVYHNKPLNKSFQYRLQQSDSIIKSSELYNAGLKMDICLKDGSTYPALIEKVMGKDLISSFYNKIIFTGTAIDYNGNYVELFGHKWNLTEMLAHAETHCMEFNKYGLLKSNPLGGHPAWKWEGYPEYIARLQLKTQNLAAGITTLLQEEHANSTGWLTLPDNTETLLVFYKYRLLVKYCLEIMRLSFTQLLADTTQEETVRRQMMEWYGKRRE